MTPADAVATRMGLRAGEAWRANRAPVRNPFRHPALHAFAALWRQGFIAAVCGDGSQPAGRMHRAR